MAIEEVKDTAIQAEEQTQAEIDYKAEYEKLIRDNEKLKRAQSNASADVSRLKKELEARMSETELAEKQREEELAQLRSENAAYKEERRINRYAKKFLELGYDATTAEQMASKLPDGIEDSFFESQKLFLENTKSKMKAEALNQQPDISSGKPLSAENVEDQITAQMRRAAFGYHN